MIEVKYYRYGQKYTSTFTFEEARVELKEYGCPNVDELNDNQVCKMLIEIFNP